MGPLSRPPGGGQQAVAAAAAGQFEVNYRT